ncbi:MAG: MFS transporter [Candidatus Dormibacteraeota bacterium]|nr:MFS transporter [Candidatus Dormibacteraeota bacterium]
MVQRVRSRLPPSIWIAFATFLVLGGTSGLLGVSWPGIRRTFHQPLGTLGLVLVADTLGYAAASAVSGPVSHRIGRGWLLFAGAVSAVAGLLLVVTAPTWPVLLVGYLLIGIAGGVYDGSLNGHVSLVGSVRSMNVLHGLWGLGAAAGPQLAYLMSGTSIGWRGAYLLVAGFEVVLAMTFFVTRPRWRVPEPPPDTEPAEVGPRPLLLSLSLLAFFLYTGVEMAGGQWSYSVLIARGTPGALAALAVTGFWAMLSAGRLLTGVLPWHPGPRALLAAAFAVALGGAALFLVTPAGLPLMALGLAPIFPTLITLNPERFGRRGAASVAGYQVGVAAAGGGVFPAILGGLFTIAGVGLLAPLQLAAAAALAILVTATEAGLWLSRRAAVPA